MEPDNMLSTSTLEDEDKKICTHTSTATADKSGDTKDRKKHNDDDDDDNDETGSTANNKDNSTKDITSSSSSVAMKRMSSTASLSESSSKRVKQEEKPTKDIGPNSEEKARSPSALIEIVNDFARDHFDNQGNTYPLLYNGTGPISPILNENEYLRGYYDEQFLDESKTSDTEAKTDWEDGREQPQEVPSATSSSENIDPSMPSTDYSLSSIQSRRKSYQQVEYERKEKRWERFLHILFSTDYALQPTRKRQTVTSKKSSTTETKQATSSAETDTKNFHPIHAWVRCLCSPYIGLEQAHSYGVWSVLHEMRQRIPEEFSVRDENDGNRTVFQTLAENKAADCKLSIEEKRDIVECIMEANYKAVHLPRQSDGRLIGHVAVENGWPVKDMLLKKVSATCA